MSAPPEPAAVELHDLWRRYGPEWVLRGVTLRIDAGRVVVLRGPNGSGKTTLLRVLATRLRPSRGSARVHGFDVVREGGAARRAFAYLSVSGGAYGALTARENLRLAAALRDAPRDDAALGPVLERVGLAAHADRPAHAFSSGMKKRLALARLLLADVPVWLLDEPFAALDDDGRALVDGLLREAQAEGRTVLLASHETELAAARADAVLELHQGRLRRARMPARLGGNGAARAAGVTEGTK